MLVEDTQEYKEQSPYSDPKLRQRLKDKIMAGSKGGRSREWSARKSQLLVLEYERAGGKYVGERSAQAESLSKWSKEDWTTIDGKPALKPDNRMGRYLPAKEWAKLSLTERIATNRKKLEGKNQHTPK